MVAQADLRTHTGRRPFEPFWIALDSGERIHITEPNRAVAMPGRLVVTTDGRSLRWIPLTRIVAHGILWADRSCGQGEE